MANALDGILVLDLSRILAGPYATMLLGDYGARVIKVEQPGRGDDTRQWGPPFTANGESAYFFCANRNKESITLDLKSTEGRRILAELISHADIVIENFRAGTIDGWGLGYRKLAALHPGLIYCSITGYGQTGPYRDRPGYDVMIEAQGGIMSITGPEDSDAGQGEPYKVGIAIVDITAGMHAVISILAALHYRQVTGAGQYIDIALFDTQLSWLANVASAYLVSGETPRRYGNAHAVIVPYQTVPAADGWLMLAVGNDLQFAKLCDLLDHPEWARDTRFAANRDRVRHRNILMPLLESCFRTRTAAAWTEALLAAGIPCSAVQDIPSALADPQAVARDMVQYTFHPVTGQIPQLGPVAKLSATSPRIGLPPPLLGEHTDAVLGEFLGLGDKDTERLRKLGVI